MLPWECTRVAESGIVLTSGQQWVMLTSQFFKASQAYLVHNTDGDQTPLTCLPWIQFKRQYPHTNIEDIPSIYTLFNFEREGRLYFNVIPDASTVSDYTLAVEYYSRIPKFSTLAANSSPEIPAEFESVILNGALKRAAQHFGDSASIGSYAAFEAEALDRLKRIDSIQPDADRRWRLIDEVIPREYRRSGISFPF